MHLSCIFLSVEQLWIVNFHGQICYGLYGTLLIGNDLEMRLLALVNYTFHIHFVQNERLQFFVYPLFPLNLADYFLL